jgi:FtsP/CotA-like multicopper oxidase with cupredoxin domain
MKSLLIVLVQLLLFSAAASAQATKVVYTCSMHPEVQQSKPGDCPKCGMTLEKKTIKVAVKRPVPKKAVKARATKNISARKQSTNTKKQATLIKTNSGKDDDIREMVKEMKGSVQELKSSVAELKGIVQEMRGTGDGPDTASTEDHHEHQMDMDNPDTSKAVTKVVYTCSMHPEVQSDMAGKCPKCGMTLIRKTVTVHQPKKQTGTQPTQSRVVYTCVMHPEVQQDRPGNCPKCSMTLIQKSAPVPGPQGLNNTNRQSQMHRQALADEMIGSRVNLQTGKTVVYHLYVRDTTVNFTGKQKRAIAINGSIPAPTLTFTEGDTAEIHLHNQLNEETSLHWHGIILPNRFDGVPFLTTKPIHPGDVYVYKFKVVQNGTYWYHSHSALQEQIGMYGALILRKREETGTGNAPVTSIVNHGSMTVSSHSLPVASNTQNEMKHYNVVLSEWADENPMQTQRRLRTANDWFAIKKGSTQSYSEAIKEGHLKTKLLNEWKRMKAMDVSDDWYQKFLVNGKPETEEGQFKAGDKVSLHVVNAGASSYFWLTFGGGKITVTGNDGNEVMPVEVDRLIVAPAETFDLLVTIPESMSYEFRATSEDRTGASSLWLGTGMKMPAFKLPRLKYFEGMKMMNDMMNVDGTMKDMGMNMSLQKMDMNIVMYPEITGGVGDTAGSGNNNPEKGDGAMGTMDHSMHNMSMPAGGDIVTLNYDMLRSPVKTSLPEGRTRTLHFNLTGNMNRYVWTLDNKTVTEADRIMIERGENLRLILTNNSMMRHPMHLHGHDFRVLNSQGEYSPLKNVIDIMPMETDTIEFAANQDGNWFFHCHILFHMMAGMGRVFTYAYSPVNPDLPDAEEAYRKFRKHKDNNMKHLMARIGLESNGSDGEVMLSTNRYALVTEWRIGTKPHHGYESETMIGRYIGVNQWLFPYVGFDYHNNKMENEIGKNVFGQYSNQNNRRTFTVGVQYLTPGLFLADARIDGKGKLRFELSREDIPVTPRLRLGVMANTDKEYMAGFRYVLNKWLTASTHYDSDMGFGAGVTITY